ncbi:hypothetical protein MHZ95_20705, partial [Sporosarcina sp. ACRSM]|uniref:hypothetical protein n=1 Tax=Sporosarcina sp. ACRSM TaxID=2918216 RepID=UPI001EF6AF45
SSFLADFESEDSFVFVSPTELVQQTVFVNVLLFSFQGSYRYCVSAATLISYHFADSMSTTFLISFVVVLHTRSATLTIITLRQIEVNNFFKLFSLFPYTGSATFFTIPACLFDCNINFKNHIQNSNSYYK